MSEKKDLEARIRQTFLEWKRVRQDPSKIHGQYLASGLGHVGLSTALRWPEKVLDSGGNGMKEIEQAELREQQNWEAHLAAIDTWREAFGRR